MYDEELEKVMLYYLIFEKEEYLLDEEDFVSDRNKKVIRAINELKAEEKEISLFSVKSKIKANQKQVLEYLADLNTFVLGTDAEKCYQRLMELSKKRKLQKLIMDMPEQINNCESIDVLGQELVKNINKIVATDEKEKTFVEQVAETSKIIEDYYFKKADYSLYTDMLDLDKLTCGLHKEELTIIGARPGMGKTTFALQIAENIAQKGIKVGIVSLEMSETQLIQKIISRKTRINSYKMRMGTLNTEEFTKISQACGTISDMPIKLVTNLRDIQHIENFARKMKNKEDLGLLIIDYIQLIRNKGKFNSREQEVADITRTLKLLSLELKIPIIGLCQLNRNAENKEPSLADLRESGAIEQDADNVIFIYQEDESTEPVVNVTIKLAKQRAGETGKVEMKFSKINSEFRSIVRM